MFKPGQKVVCVKATPSGSVKENEIYTIIEIIDDVGFGAGVLLKETTPAPPHFSFKIERFRPINDSWVDEVLNEILEEVKFNELVG